MTRPLDQRVAVYTGTFDPIHNGHFDVIRRGSRMFDRVIVGVGTNPEKATFFSAEERVELAREVVSPLGNVTVEGFTGLAVSFVRGVGARVILRGLRTTSDMESEFTMSLMNSNLDEEIETVFLMAMEPHSHLSSTLLRQIAQFGGALSKFMPAKVAQALEARVKEMQDVRA
jgi:pantetheine-phosphate adenylyltransferase